MIILFISKVFKLQKCSFFHFFLPNVQVDSYQNSFSCSLSCYMCCHWTFLIYQSSFKYLYLNIFKQKMKINLSQQPTPKSLFLLTNYLTMPNCFRQLFAWRFSSCLFSQHLPSFMVSNYRIRQIFFLNFFLSRNILNKFDTVLKIVFHSRMITHSLTHSLTFNLIGSGCLNRKNNKDNQKIKNKN